jgi:hypothetical protein
MVSAPCGRFGVGAATITAGAAENNLIAPVKVRSDSRSPRSASELHRCARSRSTARRLPTATMGVPVFDKLCYRRPDGSVFLYAFDLLQLDGQNLRHACKLGLEGIVSKRLGFALPLRPV